MKISCTPAKDAKNLADHGFSLNVCKEFPPESILLPTYPGTDVVRFKLIGMTRHGLLCAIVTPRPPLVHVIQPAPGQSIRNEEI